MSEVVATNSPRFPAGFAGDPAALLLRSARTDAAPMGAKDRVRARLGMMESVVEPNDTPVVMPALPERTSMKRTKRAPAIARLIPFQHLISTPKPLAMRKAGAAAVVFVQVAAMLAALFIRPFPKFEPVRQSAGEAPDEPELIFFAQKKSRTESARAVNRLPEQPGKATTARNATNVPRTSAAREPSSLKESIITDEHAGIFSEQIGSSSAAGAPLPEQSVSRAAVDTSSPMVFQSGMTSPVRISGTDPAYPMRARTRGISGTVVMRCVVTETGLAQNCMILKSPAYLDEAVLAASRSWRFTPVVWQGRPVSVNYVFKYKFQLG